MYIHTYTYMPCFKNWILKDHNVLLQSSSIVATYDHLPRQLSPGRAEKNWGKLGGRKHPQGKSVFCWLHHTKICHDLNKTTWKTSVILTFCPLQPPADLAGSDDHHHHVLASGWHCSGNPYIAIQKLWPVVVVQHARCNTSESSLNRLQNSGSLRDLVVCFDLLKLFMQARG